MAVLSTGPIANDPVSGVRSTQTVLIKLDNRDPVNFSNVVIEGFHLNGTRILYVQELVTIGPNEVLSRSYFANFDAIEFVFTISGPAENETQISVWGKNAAGEFVPAHRLVSDELLGTEIAEPQGDTGPQGDQGPQERSRGPRTAR